MKKFRGGIILLLIMSMVLAGCGAAAPAESGGDTAAAGGEEAGSEEAGGGDTAEAPKLKVAAMLNGNLGDKSFFDSANEGMKRMESELGCEIKVVESGYDETKWEPALIDLCEEDWDIIITGTWQMTDYVTAASEEYPDKKFIVFDTSVDYSDGQNSNVYSIEYKQNEGSYLAGVIAAELSQTGKIGVVGGMDIPVINDFVVGYIEGAVATKPDVKVATAFIGNFDDTAKGKELGLAQIDLGADVIFGVASVAGNGALEAVKEKGVTAIGVDADQALLFKDAGDEDLANVIATSVLKEVGNSLVRAIDLELNGDGAPWGKAEQLGIKEEAIGIAKNEIYEAKVPQEVRDKVEELEGKINSGEIVVKSALGMSTEEINELKNSVTP